MENSRFLWTLRNAKLFFSFALYVLLVAYIFCVCYLIVYIFE